jgi:uncharacterized membrane protein HdeD (DUF308 family)
MATTHTIASTQVKSRHPLGPLGLSIITLGIYGLVWYYKINKEVRGVTGAGSPGTSLLAITLGAFLIVPPIVSWFNTAERIRQTQDRANVSSPISAVLAVVLLFIPFVNMFATAYLQSGLNRAWERMAPAAAGHTGVPAGMVPAAPPASA